MPFSVLSTGNVHQLCGYFGFLAKNYSIIRISNSEIDQFFGQLYNGYRTVCTWQGLEV